MAEVIEAGGRSNYRGRGNRRGKRSMPPNYEGCFYCGLKNHFQKECFKRANDYGYTINRGSRRSRGGYQNQGDRGYSQNPPQNNDYYNQPQHSYNSGPPRPSYQQKVSLIIIKVITTI